MPLDLAHFVTLDRFDATDRVGTEISTFKIVDGDGTDVNIWRADVHGQFINKDLGYGGYFTVPAARGYSTGVQELGDIEGGLLYSPELAPRSLSLVIHGGLALPTSSNDAANGALSQAVLSRIADTALAIPTGTTARVGGSLIWRDCRFFARGDVAVDANLAAPGGKVDPMLRGGAGIGITAGSAAFMGEIEVVGGGPYDPVAATGALSARIDLRLLQVYAAYVSGVVATKDAFTFGIDVPL